MDLTPLLTLKDALEGATKNTDRMIYKLNNFENRLSVLDQNMSEIQESTQRYIKAKENISLTLMEMEKTYEYFRVATEVKEIIGQGLTPANQSEYLKALIKLSNAKLFFETHREIKSSSNILIHITESMAKATEACETEFDRLLASAGKSVEIVEGQCQIAHPFTPEVTKEMKALCDAFDASKYTKHYKKYEQSRISKLKQELKELESTNPQHWHAIFTVDPYQKGMFPFRDFYLLAFWLIRSEYQLWGSTLPTNQESLQTFIAICDASLAELIRVLTPLLTDEAMKGGKSTTNPVIRQSKHFLVRLDVLDIFCQKYEEYRDICHPDSRHESSASLQLNDIRKHMVEASMRSLEYLLSSSINEGFSESIATREKLQEALACDVHPATGSILYCCRELVTPGYLMIYRRMVDLSMNYGIHIRSMVAVPNEVEDLILLLLENLLVALETRGVQFDEQLKIKHTRRALNTKQHNLFEVEDKNAEELILASRKHLFLANNFHSMFNYLRDRNNKKDGGGSTTSSGDEIRRGGNTMGGNNSSRQQRFVTFMERIELKCRMEIRDFCEGIAATLGLDNQAMVDFQSAYTSETNLTNQQRLLKSKFMIFNTGMDALLAQQGEWRVTSSVLRESFSKVLVERILTTYRPFFNTYSTVKFSKKHMEEYLRFTPAQVESNLKAFFGKITRVTEEGSGK